MKKVGMLSLGRWSPVQWLVVAVTLVTIYLAVLVVLRHQNLGTAQYDLGNMEQVLWQTIHGRWFQMTDALSGLHVPRTATHADFLLLLYAPFYWLWSDPQILIVLQVLFVMSGAWPLFHFGRKYLSDRAAAAISLGYVLYPSLWWALLFDLHAVVLATPLVLWAMWAAQVKRWWVYSVACLGLLLSKEQVGVTVAMIGLYVAWQQRPRWIGALTTMVGLGWSGFMLGYAIPQARDIPGHFALGYYSQYGGSVSEIVSNIVFRPWEITADLFSRNSLGYVIILLMPLAFVSLAGLPVLLLATPELLVNVLSSNINQQSIYYQYTSVLTPFVFLSGAIGLGWLQKKLQPGWQRWMIVTIVFACALSIYRWTPLPGMRHHLDGVRPWQTSPYRPAVAEAQTLVRPDDKVAATNNLAAQFAGRDYVWAFPQALDRADVAIVLTGGDYEVVPKTEIQEKVTALQNDPDWQLIFRDREFYFFRRL